jgi:hypothetical protein
MSDHIKRCQCACVHKCHPLSTPHAECCDCDKCKDAAYGQIMHDESHSEYNPYDSVSETECEEPTLCSGCNESCCSPNEDEDDKIERCRNLHFVNDERIPNSDVPHSGNCFCDECTEAHKKACEDDMTELTAKEFHIYLDNDTCYECDIKARAAHSLI